MVLEPAEGVSGLISALVLATWTSWTSWTSSQLERTLPYDSVGQVVWPSRLLVQVGHVGHIVQVGHVGHIYIYIITARDRSGGPAVADIRHTRSVRVV